MAVGDIVVYPTVSNGDQRVREGVIVSLESWEETHWAATPRAGTHTVHKVGVDCTHKTQSGEYTRVRTSYPLYYRITVVAPRKEEVDAPAP